MTESADLFQSISNPLYMPWYLEGLASLAAGQGCWEQAACLCGARDALRKALGSGLPPADPAGHARTVAQSREALGGDAFALAYETGRSQSLEEALAEAVVAVPAGGLH